MTSALTRLSGSAFELTLTVPWKDVKEVYDRVFDELAAEIEVPGFRKGKAPKEQVDAKLDQGKIYGEVVNRLLPISYQEALKEHDLKPIVAPKVQISQAEADRDWQFIVRAAEKPSVDLDSYQEAVKTITAKAKIWKPGDGEQGKTAGQGQGEQGDDTRSKQISEIIDKLLEVCRVELPDLLLESEVNRLMTLLVDDVRAAGLTYEQYLQSKGETAESQREKFKKQAETSLRLEFILDSVANDLKVTVTPEEIKAIIEKETDSQKKKALEEQSYLIASILRRENTITKLLAL